MSTSPGHLHRKIDFNQQYSVMENGYPPLPDQYNISLMSIRAERKQSQINASNNFNATSSDMSRRSKGSFSGLENMSDVKMKQ